MIYLFLNTKSTKVLKGLSSWLFVAVVFKLSTLNLKL